MKVENINALFFLHNQIIDSFLGNCVFLLMLLWRDTVITFKVGNMLHQSNHFVFIKFLSHGLFIV